MIGFVLPVFELAVFCQKGRARRLGAASLHQNMECSVKSLQT